MVGDHCAAAAGRRQHGDARPGGRRAPSPQQRRCLQQCLEDINPRDAEITQQGTGSGVRADQCAGMRHRQFGADVGTAELVGEHRLAGRRRTAGEGSEMIDMAHRLEKQQKRIGLRIVDQAIANLADRQVRFVAD